MGRPTTYDLDRLGSHAVAAERWCWAVPKDFAPRCGTYREKYRGNRQFYIVVYGVISVTDCK